MRTLILKLLHNIRLVRTVFLVLLTFVYVMALVPPSEDLPDIDHGDKALHALAFAVLAIHMGMCRYRWGRSLGIFLFLLTYGLLIEVTQLFIPYRSFDVIDLASDLAGVLLGLVCLRYAPDFARLKPDG